MKTLRAVLYARVSTDTGEQDPEGQLRALREWAAARGWLVMGEETDRITSDPRRRRRDPPGLVKALRAIEERRADVLAVFAADRLVADPIPLLQLVARVQDLGGQVASLQDGRDLDTTTDTGELLVFLNGWYNRLRLRLGRAATRAGMARARAAGKRFGRPPATLPTADQLAALEREGVRSLREQARRLGTTVHRVRRAKRGGADQQVAPVETEGPRDPV